MNIFINRMIRASMLDSNLYEEVEADKSALFQAMSVVIISSIAAGIGLYKVQGLNGIISGTFAALLGWYLWAYITYIIGTKLLPQENTESDIGELLRTLGFASSPGILRIFNLIPDVGLLLQIIISIWMLIAMIIAVRQALDYNSTFRAIGVCLIGYIFQVFTIIVIIFLITGFNV